MLPKTDTTPDLTISIHAKRDRKLWAFELRGPFYIARFGCGYIPRATTDTLLGFALVSAMRQITFFHKQRYFTERGEIKQYAEVFPRPLRVQVECSRPAFIESVLDAMQAGQRKSRMANQLNKLLQREVKRFDTSFQLVEPYFQARLKRWAGRTLAPTKTFDLFPSPKYLSCTT